MVNIIEKKNLSFPIVSSDFFNDSTSFLEYNICNWCTYLIYIFFKFNTHRGIDFFSGLGSRYFKGKTAYVHMSMGMRT